MNKLFLSSFLILILIWGCGKKEEVNFEVFSPEAFAYDLGSIYEVNATANVKGFKFNNLDGSYFVSIDYSVDIISPSGEEFPLIFENVREGSSEELLNDIQLEAQFELDTSLSKGKYTLKFNVKDNVGGQTAEAKAEFDLSE